VNRRKIPSSVRIGEECSSDGAIQTQAVGQTEIVLDRMDAVQKKLEEIMTRLDTVSAEVKSTKGEIHGFRQQMDDFGTDLDGVKRKLLDGARVAAPPPPPPPPLVRRHLRPGPRHSTPRHHHHWSGTSTEDTPRRSATISGYVHHVTISPNSVDTCRCCGSIRA
jgi:hypothetical protein